MRYAVVFEKSKQSFGAYVPDLPGCVAVGESLAEAKSLIADAMKQHLDELKSGGEPAPDASAFGVGEAFVLGRRPPARHRRKPAQAGADRPDSSLSRDRLQHLAPVHEGRDVARGRRRLDALVLRHQHRPPPPFLLRGRWVF